MTRPATRRHRNASSPTSAGRCPPVRSPARARRSRVTGAGAGAPAPASTLGTGVRELRGTSTLPIGTDPAEKTGCGDRIDGDRCIGRAGGACRDGSADRRRRRTRAGSGPLSGARTKPPRPAQNEATAAQVEGSSRRNEADAAGAKRSHRDASRRRFTCKTKPLPRAQDEATVTQVERSSATKRGRHAPAQNEATVTQVGRASRGRVSQSWHRRYVSTTVCEPDRSQSVLNQSSSLSHHQHGFRVPRAACPIFDNPNDCSDGVRGRRSDRSGRAPADRRRTAGGVAISRIGARRRRGLGGGESRGGRDWRPPAEAGRRPAPGEIGAWDVPFPGTRSDRAAGLAAPRRGVFAARGWA